MSGLSSFFPSKLLGSMSPRDKAVDPLSRLRFVFETMPGTRQYIFTPAVRAEIISELYEAFWGPHAELFLPNPAANLPLQTNLSEVQVRAKFCGAGEEDPIIPGRPCGHIFNKGESCFRCKDCALDDSCVMCSRCFHATTHEGHNVSFFIAQQSGGSCDCGDFEAWRTPIECPFHPPPPDNAMHDDVVSNASTTPRPTTQTTPRANPKTLWGQDVHPVKGYPFRVVVPPDLLDTMTKTIAYALDTVLDILDFSPDETGVPANEADLRLQPSADPMMKEKYCVIVWNDDKHSFDEVMRLTMETTDRTRDEASDVAIRIDDVGRDVIEMNTNVPRLLEIAGTFTQVDLGVTIRRAYDTFREQMACVVIEWLLDLTRSRLSTDALIMRELIAMELLTPRRKDLAVFTSLRQTSKVIPDELDSARVDWMFMYHTKLWKKPRLNLKEIYASVLSLSQEHKLAIAVHFANIYHRIIDAYLLVDREAETSIKYFALQLFTVPSVALHVVREHRIVSRLLSIVTAFFTSQIENKRIVHPPNPKAEINVEATPFKSKRFMPVFSDLRYLCHNAPVQRLIAHNPTFIDQFAQACQLFMCVNPNKRAATNHVEYETDAWISVFNVTLSLSRVIKVYGEAFAHGSVTQLVAAINTVVHHILMVCTLSTDRLDRTKFTPVAFHDVVFGGQTYEIVLFDVLEGWVSFHHSLHWLLAELVKHTGLLSKESLKEVGLSSLRDVLLRNASERAILMLADFPLRVLAMIAQIRTGLWVRNGFAIRGQLLHYRDFMLRELCYDQDLFMLQTSFIVLDQNKVLVTTLDRFQLTGYFSGVTAHSTYENTQLASMIEELFYVLITVLSERANPGHMTLPEAVRREIVHALAVGPCTFTDLVKRVAERMVDDICFERVLKEVASFKAPEGTADTGMYELRDEVFDEVNPFFYHYTRNKREEVETILRNRLKKKTGAEEPLIIPKPLGIDHGPFTALTDIFETEVLTQILFFSVYNTLVQTDLTGTPPPSAEAILDQALHVIMLALVERPAAFSVLSTSKTFEEGENKCLAQVLGTLEHHDKMKPCKARVSWILDQMTQQCPDAVHAHRKSLEPSKRPADPADARKRAAKARQMDIMKKMKEQQASFLTNIEDDETDEDEDMGSAQDQPVSYGTCIVCQEELNSSSKSFGALGLLQPSRLIRRYPVGQGASQGLHLNEVLAAPLSLDRTDQAPLETAFPPPNADRVGSKPIFSPDSDGFPAQSTRFGLHASICSHMMHLDCFQVYSVSSRQRHRAQATRNHPENLARKEFICPLCKSLGNVILPIVPAAAVELSPVSFPDWIRASGINILKSKPDPAMEALQSKSGTGEFVFWAAQDPPYVTFNRNPDEWDDAEAHKIVDTLIVSAKIYSQQTRHLRDRPEPEPGERGAGIYLPDEVVGYTIAALETAQRGTGAPGCLVADNLTESQLRTVRGLVFCLTKLAAYQFRGRADEGREAVRQAVIKRLLPEWSRTSHTAFSYPLLLRDPFALLVEAAAVAPETLPHILVLSYYACLARTVVGIVHMLHKHRASAGAAGAAVAVMAAAGLSLSPSSSPSPSPGPASGPGSTRRAHEHAVLFGDVRMFFMSVVRHSPVFESTAGVVFKTFGEGAVERLLYAFTLPFLRRALILCRAVVPTAFAPPAAVTGGASVGGAEPDEYARLLATLRIPPLADLPNQEALQNALSGWCAHYGHLHAASQLGAGAGGVPLDHPTVYTLTRLPAVLDNLFEAKAIACPACGSTPLDAAICLICGTVCCLQSHCCTDLDSKQGECNMHTRECGGAIGIYFLIKRCSLLYLYAGNGTFAPSPYLDVHGEVDMSMRRGRRQFLHPARWEEIKKIWLGQGVPTLVARKLESTVDNGGWETL